MEDTVLLPATTSTNIHCKQTGIEDTRGAGVSFKSNARTHQDVPARIGNSDLTMGGQQHSKQKQYLGNLHVL